MYIFLQIIFSLLRFQLIFSISPFSTIHEVNLFLGLTQVASINTVRPLPVLKKEKLLLVQRLLIFSNLVCVFDSLIVGVNDSLRVYFFLLLPQGRKIPKM